MSDHRQRQRHGVTKGLVEGAGGLIVGSALVLFLRQLLRPRRAVGGRGRGLDRGPAAARQTTEGAPPGGA